MVTILRRKLGWLGISISLVLVAVIVAVAFFAFGALSIGQYTAYATIYFRVPKALHGAGGSPTNVNIADAYQAWTATKVGQLKSGLVLSAGLRQLDCGRLPSLRTLGGERDRVAWLQRRLSVTFPGRSELALVSLRSRDPEEVVALVNAVVDAYIEQVAKPELDEMKKPLAFWDHEIAEKSKELREMIGETAKRASVDVEDEESRRVRLRPLCEALSARLSAVEAGKSDIERLKAELASKNAALRHAPVKAAETAEIERLRGSIADKQRRREAGQAEIKELLDAAFMLGRGSRPELHRVECEKLAAAIAGMMVEREKAKLELDVELDGCAPLAVVYERAQLVGN